MWDRATRRSCSFPDGVRCSWTPAGSVRCSGFDVGARVLAPALWASGVRRLDALLLTHGDPDHLGGAPRDDVVTSARGGVGGCSGATRTGRCARCGNTPAHWRPSGAPYRRGRGSLRRREVRALHPPLPTGSGQKVRNDDSVVLEMMYGDVAVLLLGRHRRRQVEQSVVAAADARPPACRESRAPRQPDVQLAGVAGELAPSVAIVSCGRGNTFGHPAPRSCGGSKLSGRGCIARTWTAKS